MIDLDISGKLLNLLDVGGFRAFIRRHDVEFDRVIFRQALEAFSLDRGEMHEHIRRAIFRSDKAESLRVIEPLHFASCTHVIAHLYCFKFPMPENGLGGRPRRH